ncbi:MAG: tRNA guanosine(34) transglycosylase Tgt [Elusimicrobia bacterium CG1_02_63_36]|nr:MAG: tRNA guanosine(34) transglycosylase Tgt [Elusimicrobia bacterium CG1_02_63_36]
MSCFEVLKTAEDCAARLGRLTTGHGVVETPVFQPVATIGSVKALSTEDLEMLGIRAILANAYHLCLRPGADIVEHCGGLHAMMDFKGSILTDSGGFQIFSLSKLRSLSEEGVTFSSHLDGSKHTITPETIIAIQGRLGSDIWTSLDECPPFPCTEQTATNALERTARWTERSAKAFEEENPRHGGKHLFFPIVQGSLFPQLRRRACEHIARVRHDGVSIGGFSVGEVKEQTWESLAVTTEILDKNKPRYLMGMGAPEDLWNAVMYGVDMLDCVWPTRIARNGVVMTASGRINIKNAQFRRDTAPLDPDCACPVCRRYTRAYLCHLFRSKELLSFRLLTIHNLFFTLGIMARIRDSIAAGTFLKERAAFLEKYGGN